MSLIDNNPEIDDEVLEIMEGLLREHLANYDEGQWFTLRSLYEKMNIKFTLRREGSLDQIIRRTLNEWNWFGHFGHYWGRSYIRRDRPTDLVEISLLDGTNVATRYSWPPFSLPEPTPERKALLEEVRQGFQRRKVCMSQGGPKLDA
jgi:hypothetical protein